MESLRSFAMRRNLRLLAVCLAPALMMCCACEKAVVQKDKDDDSPAYNVRPAPPDGLPVFSDSVLLVSAVNFSSGYDWRRDSLHGKVPFKIVLFKNFMPVLQIAGGPGTHFSADADSHHIIGGKLYTEYAGAGEGTVICCDGVEVLRFPEAERLLGLLPADSSLYTLSRPVDSPSGFRFRKDGELLYVNYNASVCGAFGKPSYGNTGALYLNDSIPAFAYTDGDTKGFAMTGTQETAVYGAYKGARILDVKAMGTHAVAAWSKYLKINAVEAELWGTEATDHVVTYIKEADVGRVSSVMYVGMPCRYRDLASFEGRIFYSDNGSYVLGDRDNGGMLLYSCRDSVATGLESCYLASEGCAFFSDEGKLWLALTASDGGKVNRLRSPEGKETEIEMNGYLTAVEYWTKD